MKNSHNNNKVKIPDCRDKKRNLFLACMLRTIFKEQKSYRRGTKGTHDLLYIEQHILEKAKTRRKNITMACIDKKSLWYNRAIVDLGFENVQKARQNPKLHHQFHGWLEGWPGSRMFGWLFCFTAYQPFSSHLTINCPFGLVWFDLIAYKPQYVI